MTHNKHTSSVLQQQRPRPSGCLFSTVRNTKDRPELDIEGVSHQDSCAEQNDGSEPITEDYFIDHKLFGERLAVTGGAPINRSTKRAAARLRMQLIQGPAIKAYESRQWKKC